MCRVGYGVCKTYHASSMQVPAITIYKCSTVSVVSVDDVIIPMQHEQACFICCRQQVFGREIWLYISPAFSP